MWGILRIHSGEDVNDGFEMRRYLIERCKITCAGRERYSGKLRHEPDCPAYALGLVD